MKFQRLTSLFVFVTAMLGSTAFAQTPTAVAVDGSWARATFAGQKASGAYMRLTAQAATRLVRVETPAAGVAEIHEMKMNGDVMQMRAVSGLELPAGTPVELKPGGYHVMLMGLKAPLVNGSSLPLTLVFQDAKGVEYAQQLQIPVSAGVPGSHAH